jgi:hypothetical protein
MDFVSRIGEPHPFNAGWLLVHNSDEAKALARNGTDQLLFLAVVTDRRSRGVDAAGQRRFRYDAPLPHRSNEIILANDAIAILQQIDQQVEYLRFDGNGLRTAAQLTPVGIEPVISKDKLHVVPQISAARLKE